MSESTLAERIAKALARIEAAVQRIEQAKAAPGLPFDAYANKKRASGDPELQKRYDFLQSETGEALKQIEHVLAKLEQDDAT